MKYVDGTKSLQYRDIIIKIDNGFIILLLLDGCQMEVFNIFSFSPDKIQFWQYTHIYCIGKLLIFFLMTTKWNFAYLPHFITLDMGILPPSTELCSIPKKLLTAMTWSLV